MSLSKSRTKSQTSTCPKQIRSSSQSAIIKSSTDKGQAKIIGATCLNPSHVTGLIGFFLVTPTLARDTISQDQNTRRPVEGLVALARRDSHFNCLGSGQRRFHFKLTNCTSFAHVFWKKSACKQYTTRNANKVASLHWPFFAPFWTPKRIKRATFNK